MEKKVRFDPTNVQIGRKDSMLTRILQNLRSEWVWCADEIEFVHRTLSPDVARCVIRLYGSLHALFMAGDDDLMSIMHANDLKRLREGQSRFFPDRAQKAINEALIGHASR